MRISRKKPRYTKEPEKTYRTNMRIHSDQVRLIDEDGQNIGVVDTNKAIEMAQERGLDLVEVSPLANPPVAKIVDYSKLKYEEEKERRKEKAKQKKVDIKGICLSLRISDHDIAVRVKQAERFINQGDKVKIEMILRGRERGHVDLAREIIKNFIKATNELVPVATEQAVSVQGGKLSVLIAKQ